MTRAPRTLADQPLPFLMDEARRPPSNTGKQPSYIADHRQRLRSRFVHGGAAAIPDYEMLELVLFRAIPRRGTRIRLAGEGEAGMRGGPSGDLYIFIEVADHELFERDGPNLFCRVPVSMSTAALGGNIEVPTIDGGRGRVQIPAGSQSGRQMRLRGKGMPPLRGGGVGDMIIELAVETPVNLTNRQKELLREFEGEAQNNNPESSNFFSSVKSFWDSMKG